MYALMSDLVEALQELDHPATHIAKLREKFGLSHPLAPHSSRHVRNMMAKIDRHPLWRDSKHEPDLENDTHDHFAREHVAHTSNGSLVVGTPHGAHTAPKNSKAHQYWKKHVVPRVLNHADQAVKSGKKVVFVSEDEPWWTRKGEEGALDKLHPHSDSEQFAVASHLHKNFGGEHVRHDTFDSPHLHPFSKASKKTLDKLTNFTGNRLHAHVAMFAFHAGQGSHEDGSDIDKMRASGWLPASVEHHLRKHGFDPEKVRKSEHLRKQLYNLSFPQDSGLPHNSISAVGEYYNHLRQQHLMNKIAKVEKEGHVAIATPGHSHAYNLKHALENT